MSTIALLDVFSYVHGHDFTGDSNKTLLTLGRTALDRSNFRSRGWKRIQGGLRTVAFEQVGYWQAGADSVDEQSFADLGVVDRVHTIGPSEVEGGVAYMWQGGKFNYTLFDAGIDQMAPFSLNSQGASKVGVVRGLLAVRPVDDDAEPVTVSATGAIGSAVNLGAPVSGQSVYATLHVLGAPGTTVTVQLQSDTASNFPSPTTRATIGPLTVTGGTWLTPLPGPFAGETHWRFNVSAITGSFTLAGAIAVQ